MLSYTIFRLINVVARPDDKARRRKCRRTLGRSAGADIHPTPRARAAPRRAPVNPDFINDFANVSAQVSACALTIKLIIFN